MNEPKEQWHVKVYPRDLQVVIVAFAIGLLVGANNSFQSPRDLVAVYGVVIAFAAATMLRLNNRSR